MDTLPSIAEWWDAVESTPAGAMARFSAPEWLSMLTRAQVAELEIRTAEARRCLEQARPHVPDGSWSRAFRIVDVRIAVREARAETIEPIRSSLRAMLASIPAAERPHLARAWHLLGLLGLRSGRLVEAEEALSTALSLAGQTLLQTWILDGFGQIFQGGGAWEEARRTWVALLQRRSNAGDVVGVAITAGHVALLDLQLDAPAAAGSILQRTLAAIGDKLPAATRLRLRTLLLQAYLEAHAKEPARVAAGNVEETLREFGDDGHYLTGYASLALARAAAMFDDVERARAWFGRASKAFTLPEQRALLAYWEARSLPDASVDDAWFEEMQKLFRTAGSITEAEVLTHLLLAERAAWAGNLKKTRQHVELASRRAIESNNRLWIEHADRASRALDPEGMVDRLVTRYTGRSSAELAETTKEDATIVFCDLVGFTPRSQQLTPEETLSTVRSLFELSSSLMAKHRVRPLTYLGDGLLAVCQGDDHRARGLAFARELVSKAGRVTAVRRALGETWGLDLRAGVSAGPVVLGVLGTLFKLEYTAIGLTVNLASRLQAAANPGEVVCDVGTAGDEARGRDVESLALKGITGDVRAIRIRCD